MLRNSGLSAQTPPSIKPDFLYILKSVAIAYAVSLTMLLPAAFIAAFRCFSDKGVSLCAKLICALGVLVCGFMSGRHSEKGGMLSGAISGTAYTFILWIIGSIASQSAALGSSAASALAIGIVCGAAGGILGINSKSKGRK